MERLLAQTWYVWQACLKIFPQVSLDFSYAIFATNVDSSSNLPTGLKNMILVMHWAVKERRLDRLLQSTSISISIDDRKDYRIVRYRCNLPRPESTVQGPRSNVQPGEVSIESHAALPSSLEDWSATPALAASGILGVYRVGADVAENTLESHDMDKSEAMSKTLLEIVKRACQNPDGESDSTAVDHICRSIRHFASDQGPNVAKVGKLLASGGKLKNLVYLSFDAAHQIRIASKDPLQALPDFEKQWSRLFSGRNALLPAIHHSKVWQTKLLACERMILKAHGSQGGLDRAVQSLSFAAHRFDSAATPLFKFCSLIRAIALLCGMQAADVAGLCDPF